jgi:hypothetical protein
MGVEGHAPTNDPARTFYWLSQGQCPDCKKWDGAGDYNGHVPLDNGECPKCGFNGGESDA